MKTTTLAVFLALAIAGCKNTAKNSSREDEHPGTVDRKKNDDERVRIIAGEALGKVNIGQNVEDLDKLLGKPDAGDAAMGKAWGIWFDLSTKDQIVNYAVYSTYRDSMMNAKVVKQIRTESARFETEDGLAVSKDFSLFTKKYPNLKKVYRYYNVPMGDTVQVFDAVAEGIAIEEAGGKCTAINIHQAGVPMVESYYSINSDWKKLN